MIPAQLTYISLRALALLRQAVVKMYYLLGLQCRCAI